MAHPLSICSSCNSLNKYERTKVKTAVCGKCGNPLNLKAAVTQVSTEGFRRILGKTSDLVVVDFWASWCGPCQVYGPEFEKASLINEGTFLKVNTESEHLLSQELGIRGIPCTVFFKNGKEVQRQSGAMSADQLSTILRSL
jgi:thioredoxin 2